jgi:hypothetical protein
MVGDLGAARDEERPVLRSETLAQDAGLAAEVVNVDKEARPGEAPRAAEPAVPHDPKDAPAELVSLQPAPLAEVSPIATAKVSGLRPWQWERE